MRNLEKIGFGGGCHWCTEAVFQALNGVKLVEQGYIASTTPNESFSEGVIVTYKPDIISLEQLIEIHLQTHNATSNHSFRTKYRSAMYYYREEQKNAFAKAKQELQATFSKPIITTALAFSRFKPSRESIQDYYAKNPQAPFCSRYILPKLEFLNNAYNELLDE